MSRLFVAFLVLLCVNASANEGVEAKTSVVCYPNSILLKHLKKFGEEPMVIGKRDGMEDTVTVVYVNKDTGTYTIVEMDTEAGCVISLGEKIKYRFPNSLSL